MEAQGQREQDWERRVDWPSGEEEEQLGHKGSVVGYPMDSQAGLSVCDGKGREVSSPRETAGGRAAEERLCWRHLAEGVGPQELADASVAREAP